MESSTEIALRPLRLGEILDQAIRLYRHNFLTFMGIIALAEIPLLLVQTALPLLYKSDVPVSGNTSSDIFSAHWFITNTAIFFVRWIFVDGLGSAVLTYAIARCYLGQKTGILGAYRQLGSSWLKLLTILFVFAVVLFMAAVWALIPCVGWFSGPGLLIFLSMTVMPLIPATVIIERQAGVNAIVRAWDLARRRFLWILGFDMILTLFSWILFAGPSLVITSLVTGILASSSEALATFDIYNLVSGVSATLFGVLFLPIQTAVWTLIYFDLRVRTEAFDIALLAVNDPEDTNQLVVLPSAQKWIAAEDIAKLFLVSLLVVGFFVLINILPVLLILLAAAFSPR